MLDMLKQRIAEVEADPYLCSDAMVAHVTRVKHTMSLGKPFAYYRAFDDMFYTIAPDLSSAEIRKSSNK